MPQIAVRIIPNSSKSYVVNQISGVIKIKIQEPSNNGKANRALVRLISEKLGIPIKKISIISGQKSRNKILSIDWPFSIDQIISKLLIDYKCQYLPNTI